MAAAEDTMSGMNERKDCMYDKKMLLELSYSPLVRAPQGMASLEEWYGPWKPYMPASSMSQSRSRDGRKDTQDASFPRRESGRAGHARRGPSEDGTERRSATFKPSGFVPAPGAPRHRGMRRPDDDERGWRRPAHDEQKGSGVPAWMQDDGTQTRPSATSGVESIEAFKAQMREMERQQRGEKPSAPPVPDATEGPEETEAEQASRFARFFDVHRDTKETKHGTSSPAIGSLDLFGMWQNLQSRDADKRPSAPTASSSAVPKADTSAASGPGHARGMAHSQPVSQTHSPLVSPPTQSAAPSVLPPSLPDQGAAPKPSAADMASMQMLMSKLMSARHPSSAPLAEAPPGLGTPPRPAGPPGLSGAAHGPPGLAGRPPAPPPPPPTGQGGAPMTSMAFLQSLMNTSVRPPPSVPPGMPAPWPPMYGAPGGHGPPGAPPPGLLPRPPPGMAAPPWMQAKDP